MAAISRKEGSAFGSYDFSLLASSSGGGVRYIFPEIYFPHTGPAITAVGKPIMAPKRITQPSCTLIISATATGPGVGGIKLCVAAKPASKGIP